MRKKTKNYHCHYYNYCYYCCYNNENSDGDNNTNNNTNGHKAASVMIVTDCSLQTDATCNDQGSRAFLLRVISRLIGAARESSLALLLHCFFRCCFVLLCWRFDVGLLCVSFFYNLFFIYLFIYLFLFVLIIIIIFIHAFLCYV